LFLSNKFHNETVKLENLNRIYKSKNAKVVVGQKKGNQIMENIKAYKLGAKVSNSDDDKDETSSNSSGEHSDEIKYQPPSFSDIEDR
jgi:hypothetical protein